MRNKDRIPILCNYFHQGEILQKFLNTDDKNVVFKIFNKFTSVMLEWNSCPDYRFGQLLANMNLVSKEIEDNIWNIEEDDWLIKNNYCNIEDIKFWGVNYYKNGKKRKTTKFKLLKYLDIDHIQNIIKFFEDQNALHRLNKEYLEYFNKRIKLNN